MLAGDSLHVGANRFLGSVAPMSTYIQIKVNELFNTYLLTDSSIYMYLWDDRVGKSEIHVLCFVMPVVVSCLFA